MLKRKLYSALMDWKEAHSHQKALLILGGPQTGKTTLVRSFGEQNYKQVIEVNFLKDPSLTEIFTDSGADSILSEITSRSQKSVVPGETLLILDEIQICPQARTAVQLLVQDGRCACIEIGLFAGNPGRSAPDCPTDCEQLIHLHPLCFEEFLWAAEYPQQQIESLRSCYHQRKPVDSSVHAELMRLFRTYMVTGGMPDAVQTFIRTRNMEKVLQSQKFILSLYQDTIEKYTSGMQTVHAWKIFARILPQMCQTNRRFKMNSLGRNMQFRNLENCFLRLEEAGLTLPCFNTSAPVSPLVLNEKRNLFKLFMPDTGLLWAAGLNSVQTDVLQGDLSVHGISILENVFAQELKAKGFSLFYFDSKKIGELNFVVQNEKEVDILEIKSGKDCRKHSGLNKALSVSEWKFGQTIVFCDADVSEEDVLYLPVYMIMFYGEAEQGPLKKAPDHARSLL